MLCDMSMPHPGTAPRIIIADDDDLLSAVVASSLESHGYTVSCAPCGLISLRTPVDADLVILDAHVPGQDFDSTLELLRRQSVAVLVFSGEHSLPPGVDSGDYLAKPVDLDRLLGAVARLVPTAAKG
jgi:DNA-binding response OmpR family regulator